MGKTVTSEPMPQARADAIEFLRKRKQAYAHTFNLESEHGKRVMHDLRAFCRGNASTSHPDPYIRAQLDGRREVWLRICTHLGLDEMELYQLLV